ncbi:MAG: TolC family protein [Flavobacteriia bacterium]|nr:TolC family protein [Flavobacteriia bacterium]
MSNRIFIGIATLLLAWNTQAQEVLTLDQAMATALEHNHNLKIAELSSQQATNAATMGNAGMLPNVVATAGANVSQQNSNLEFATGQTQDVEGAQSLSQNMSLGISQTLFAGGRIQRSYALLKTAEQSASLAEQQAMESTIAMVWSQYTGLALLQRSVITAQQVLLFSSQRFERAMLTNSLGGSNTTERLSAEVDLNRDSISLLEVQAQYQLAKNSFATYIGWENSDFLVDESGITDAINATDLPDDLLANLRENNSALLLAQTSVNAAGLQEELQQSTLFPTIAAQASYGLNQSQAEAGFLTASQQQGLNAGISLQYNLFSGFQSKTQRQNAALEVLKAQEQLDQVSETLENTLANAMDVFNNAIKIAAIETKNMEVAERRLVRMSELHALGKASSLELREAQIAWLNANNGMYSAQFQAVNAKITVLALVGSLGR